MQQAFEGKKSLTKKWEEEIRKREVAEGGGGYGKAHRCNIDGHRRFANVQDMGGGGGGSGPNEPFDWGEFGEVSMATTSLILFVSTPFPLFDFHCMRVVIFLLCTSFLK